MQPIDPKGVFRNVSRETFLNLELFSSLLLKWNSSINLIGKSTEDDIWERHIVDSVQIHEYIPDRAKILTDFGSGAGLPGMVIAIMGFPEVNLIESDSRKCAFLTNVAGTLNLKNVKIHNQRIEKMKPIKSDVVTARAYASVNDILKNSRNFLKTQGLNILLKGSNVNSELDEAVKNFKFDAKLYPSITNKESSIVVISGLKNESKKPLQDNSRH